MFYVYVYLRYYIDKNILCLSVFPNNLMKCNNPDGSGWNENIDFGINFPKPS